MRETKQIRSIQTELKTRSEEGGPDKYIEGYFIRFNEETKLCAGIYEEVRPSAVVRSLKENDIYCLYGHDRKKVLGRTGNGTLELKADNIGLWGRVKINEEDPEAVSVYAKVKRQDVHGCSFAFPPSPIEEAVEHKADGSIKFILNDIDLREVSVVTFPAYEHTGVQARQAQVNEYRDRQLEQRKLKIKERLTQCLNS